MRLWDWAQAAYARPGVREACLALQDRHGQNVCFLLWAAWARTSDPDVFDAAARPARGWEAGATALLRATRRNLAIAAPPVDDDEREALREAVRAAELTSERLMLEALEADTPAGPRSASTLASLRAAAAAWGGEAPDGALRALAAALDPGLPFGGEARHDRTLDLEARSRMDKQDAELERDLRARVAVLTQDHADLDAAIQALALSPLPDMLVIGRLKRKKLLMKDEIARLQDQLTPDIIA